MTNIPNVQAATDALLSVLSEGRFEYALVGGLAVVLRGHDRLTQDVDALVWDLDDRLEDLVALLDKQKFRPSTDDQILKARATRLLHLVWRNQVAVDIMLGLVPFERETLDNSTEMVLDHGATAVVAAAEDLVIMKLIASRERDISDVIALKELYPDLDRNRIRSIVRDYAEALERADILDNLKMWFS